jgi:hypothetical protein
MPDELKDLWKLAPALVILLIVLWAGYKGYWYWGSGARGISDELKRERDEWKALALDLLKKKDTEKDTNKK